MNDQYQNRSQKSSLELLNMIHSAVPTNRHINKWTSYKYELPVLFNTGMIDFNKENALIFGGRNVIRIDRIFPIKVSKRLIKPQFTSDGYFGPNSKIILMKMFGVSDLSKILLLITSTATERRKSEECILHGYDTVTEYHLGLTVISRRERKLIVREHNVHNYDLIICSGYIELQDAYKKTPLRDQIFQILRQKPVKDVCVWNGEKTIILHYQYSGTKPRNMILWKRIITPMVVKSPAQVQSVDNLLSVEVPRQSGGQETLNTAPNPNPADTPPHTPESPLETTPDPIKKSKKRRRRRRKNAVEALRDAKNKMNKNKKPIKKEVEEPFKIKKEKVEPPPLFKKKRKPRNKRTYLVPNANLDPEERKALFEKFFKERQHRRERKWNRFHNCNSKRLVF